MRRFFSVKGYSLSDQTLTCQLDPWQEALIQSKATKTPFEKIPYIRQQAIASNNTDVLLIGLQKTTHFGKIWIKSNTLNSWVARKLSAISVTPQYDIPGLLELAHEDPKSCL